jgi:hypothetical protein
VLSLIITGGYNARLIVNMGPQQPQQAKPQAYTKQPSSSLFANPASPEQPKARVDRHLHVSLQF